MGSIINNGTIPEHLGLEKVLNPAPVAASKLPDVAKEANQGESFSDVATLQTESSDTDGSANPNHQAIYVAESPTPRPPVTPTGSTYDDSTDVQDIEDLVTPVMDRPAPEDSEKIERNDEKYSGRADIEHRS